MRVAVLILLLIVAISITDGRRKRKQKPRRKIRATIPPTTVTPTVPPFQNPFNSTLSDNFFVFDGPDKSSRIVVSNNTCFVMYAVKKQGKEYIYNPLTIGRVLGYLYERAEFGPNGPPGGFTIELMGHPIPTRKQRELLEDVRKIRRAKLVFTQKQKPVD